jgi:two-component system chemotaxis response regulator CheB
VDDTALFRKLVSDALALIPGVEVVGTASNGKLALDRLESLRPDLMTLDLEMPEMNGLQTLEALSQAGTSAYHGNAAPGAIMLSSHTVRGGELTMRALELGAFDFITKPDGGTREDNLAQLRTGLASRIQAFGHRREIRQILGAAPRRQPLPAPAPPSLGANRPVPGAPARAAGPPIVLIGVSTGGPAALAQVLPALPPGFSAPIFIVQHMPPLFTEALAGNLQAKSSIRVREARDGEIAVAGCAYVAPGGRHMKVAAGPSGEVVVRIVDDPPENHCRPAVDVLFRSAATEFPRRSIAAILTGMGHDGTEGLRCLKRTGCLSIAQDEATSTVFGMPREAILAGVVDQVLPLNQIAAALIRSVGEAR